MQAIISFCESPNGIAILSSIALFILSELKGFDKGGSLFQSIVVDNGLKISAKFASDEAKSLTADVLKIEGKDPTQIIPQAQPAQTQFVHS